MQHRERLIAARAELLAATRPASRGTSAFAGGDTDELDDAEVPIGAVAHLEPAPWQEGAERRSSAKKAAIPDTLDAHAAAPRPAGSVPPGRSSAPIQVAGDSPDSD